MVAEDLVAAYLDNSAALVSVSTRERAGRGELLRTQARRLVADLLGSQYWFSAIRPLGKVNPLEVATIGEAILVSENFQLLMTVPHHNLPTSKDAQIWAASV